MKIEFDKRCYAPRIEVEVFIKFTEYSDWHGREIEYTRRFEVVKYTKTPSYIVSTNDYFEGVQTKIIDPDTNEEELCDISQTDLGKEVIHLCEENKVFE
jgi:hypothetical protein